ncbi:hypothetical protein LCGC14_0874580 [marine sediment metagenome]|uniref:Uncharacterized protein n=1 Tax=marine sediment metagenome TaxID=412755 RepID=A0A0F9RNC4_9ZZZZ|nr:MAG: Long-chain-fatty-acid--CoA ligase FadD17 [Candidatus Lokiarchaeum sp. GC14_75]HEC38497.1 long-chain-acyl-CoA synthetase [bacterium]
MGFELTPQEKNYLDKVVQEENKLKQIPNQSLGTRIEKQASEKPDKISLLFGKKSFTWSSVNKECNRYAKFFKDLGLKSGDTVSIMMENSPEYLFLTGGINKIQGISALINTHQRKQALIHALNISTPEWILVDKDCLPYLLEVRNELPVKNDEIFVCGDIGHLKHSFRELKKESEEVSTKNPNSTSNSLSREIIFNIFTSGTTGLPKAVTLSNFKFLRVGIFGVTTLQLETDNTIYVPLPLYHGLGLNVGWGAAVWKGASIALRKRFSASEYWKDIKNYNATCTLYIGEIPRYLLNRPESEFVNESPLRRMVGLGLKKDVWERFSSRFNVPHIVEYFGSTEIGGFVNVSGKPGMVGRNVYPGVHIVKLDENSHGILKDEKKHCILCKPGETGIVLVQVTPKSDFTGYKSKKATEKKLITNVIEDGDIYFNTGDILKLHEDQWVSFVERSGDTFRWKGENVSTSEVESIILSFAGIRSCVVYGVKIPHSDGKGGMVAITLINSEIFDVQKFSEFLNNSLPRYAIPIFVRTRKDLETTGTFKLKKVNLKEEGYDPNKISDPLYIWDSNSNYLKKFTLDNYRSMSDGNLRF